MQWLTRSWYELLPPPWSAVMIVLCALGCGLLVGIELERKHKAVGIRTLVMVCLGATVFTMVSGALDHRTPIAGQIISGIGFLGAGVILRGPFGVTGLTSAATIWATAAVGMTIGIGYAGAGLVFSLFLLGVAAVLTSWEQRHLGMCSEKEMLLTFRTNGGKTLIRIEEALDEFRIPRDRYRLVAMEDARTDGAPGPERARLTMKYCNVHKHHYEFLAFLAKIDEIEEIRREKIDGSVAQRAADS